MRKAIVIPANRHIEFLGGTFIGSIIAHKMFADKMGAVLWDLVGISPHSDIQTAYFYDTDEKAVTFKGRIESMNYKHDFEKEEKKYLTKSRMKNWKLNEDRQVWLKLTNIQELRQPHELSEFIKISDDKKLRRVQNPAIVVDPEFEIDNTTFSLERFIDDYIYRLVSQKKEKLMEKDLEEILWYKMLEKDLQLVERQKGKQNRLDLCFENGNEDFVVVELKKGIADFTTLKQIMRYLQKISVKRKPRKLNGIILCRRASPKLRKILEDPKQKTKSGSVYQVFVDEYELHIEFPKIQKVLDSA